MIIIIIKQIYEKGSFLSSLGHFGPTDLSQMSNIILNQTFGDANLMMSHSHCLCIVMHFFEDYDDDDDRCR